MEMEDLSLEVTQKDTAAELAAEAAASDPANRAPKRSSNTCQPCRLRKVRCLPGDGVTCANCDRLGFTCSFQDTSSPRGDGDAAVSLPRRRVRLACINCHSRKARCTGETPKCARCQSQGIECVYRPTKRAATANGPNSAGAGGHHGDSENDSPGSEPPEKRRLTMDEASLRNYRYSPDAIGGNGPYSSECFTFPEESLITRAFNNFFRHVHHVPVFSFLHRASLMQRYHSGMMDRALLLAVVGITSLLTDLGPGMREYGSKCIDECQRMILSDIENPSTIKIQALVFIMKHRMLTRRFTGAFMLAAVAGRFSYALRLNYENPNLCFLARESRRRLMWAFLTIDSGINGGYPDFTILPSEAMHIQLPCNERNFEFDLPQITQHLRPIPDKPFPDDIGSLSLHVRLLWIRSRVLYCTKNVLAMPETELSELPKLIEVLAHELKTFHEHLPASFRYSESNLQLRAYSPRLCVFVMIHIWWRQCHCDLYRIVLIGLKEALPQSAIDRLSPQFVSLCARQCYEHAVAMVDIFRAILQLDGGLPVTDLDLSTCAYQCARMLYFANRTNASEFQLSTERFQEYSQRCLQITRHMLHVPAGAAVHADLDKLVNQGLSESTTPSMPGSPNAPRNNIASRHVLTRHNPVQQMRLYDESEITSMPILSPPLHAPSPMTHANTGVLSAQHTPVSAQTPATKPMAFADLPIGETAMPKPNLAPVVPPEGLDNNNAFEGAMDGFDFNFDSFGNTGLESVSWFSNEWLNGDFPQNMGTRPRPPFDVLTQVANSDDMHLG